MKRAISAILFHSILLIAAGATGERTEDTNDDGKPDRWIESSSNDYMIIKSDRNFDGEIDHILEIDESALKTSEVMDFNYDGEMDDYSYFSRGVLQRRELDTNYDDAIDLWVYMHKGVYVKKVERDTDFDGEVDYKKDYDIP